MPPTPKSEEPTVSIQWTNTISPRLDAAEALTLEFVDATLQFHEATGQNDMRQNAPWTDRTGNARQGLFAKAYVQDQEHGMVLYHTVDYGIYLETAHSGKYKIVMPAVNRTGRAVMRTLRGLMNVVSRGGLGRE